jgi:hypothetical protein
VVFEMSVAENIEEKMCITGYAISDFYYIHEAAKNVHANYKPKMLRQVYESQRSGFQFRRLYLTFDKKIDSDFSSRVRFEMNHTDYSYSTMTPDVKDAYLQWNFHNNHSACFGISASPAFSAIEKFWGYRYLDKSASDYYSIRSSRDFGVAFKGELFSALNYHFFWGNGESNASERSGRLDKLYSLSLYNRLDNGLFFQVYSDYRLSKNSDMNEFSGQFFLGYQNEVIRFGLQYTYQENKLMRSEKNGDITLFSMPVIYNYSEKINFICRGSYYIAKEEQNYEELTLLGGFEYKMRDKISLMPNILYNDYIFEENKKAGKDVISRMTLYYNFK